MDKKSKAIKYILSISLILVLYMLLTSDLIKFKPGSELDAKGGASAVDLQVLNDEYKAGVKIIFAKLNDIVDDVNETSLISLPKDGEEAPLLAPSQEEILEKLLTSKEKLINLRLPTEYKELHLDLVLSFSRLENSIRNGSSEDKESGLLLVSKVTKDYPWLTD